ncbi:hypothetical protein QBC37DRAFT_380238 [Rhypophila decipiens]|uniref:CFEM domain-containing protein n=1 Tax=Rhypophila decipiens TaxID=261697 RepID=A0AAN7B1Y5_9PEZI|nr:hypothetical protein QBC37DRAFT_380238 [Rhypophila decipiens]
MACPAPKHISMTTIYNLLSFLAISNNLQGFVAGSEVDIQKLPQCAWANCFPYHSSAIGCSSLSKDCFCHALAPVNCAAKNCTGNEWYAVEDWFNSECPNPTNVTLQRLPQCSRKCVRDSLIPEYCQSQLTRNCFCRLETEFERLTPCITDGCNATTSESEANETLSRFYRNTCVYQPTVDGNGVSGNSYGVSDGGPGGDEVVYAPKSPDPTDPSPPERVNLIAGLTSSFLAFFVVVVAVWIWLSRHRAKSGKKLPWGDFFDPPAPPPYSVDPPN